MSGLRPSWGDVAATSKSGRRRLNVGRGSEQRWPRPKTLRRPNVASHSRPGVILSSRTPSGRRQCRGDNGPTSGRRQRRGGNVLTSEERVNNVGPSASDRRWPPSSARRHFVQQISVGPTSMLGR